MEFDNTLDEYNHWRKVSRLTERDLGRRAAAEGYANFSNNPHFAEGYDDMKKLMEGAANDTDRRQS